MEKPHPSEVSFILPPPLNLLPFRPHARGEEIVSKTHEWAKKKLLLCFPSSDSFDRFWKGKGVMFLPLSFPSFSDDRLFRAQNLITYLFALDDVISEDIDNNVDISQRDQTKSREVYTQIAGVFKGSHVENAGPWASALMDVWNLMAGFEEEHALRARHRDYTYEEMKFVRRKSSGMDLTILLIEYGIHVDLTDEFKESKSLRRLHELALDQMLLYHEILSFRKEYFAGLDEMNSVAFWARPGHSKLQEAVDTAMMLITKSEREFVKEREELLKTPLGQQSNVFAYLEELGYTMAGCQRFQFLAPRYHGLNHEWNGAMSGKFILTPEKTIFPSVSDG
ncbi:hypothetical protein TWF718_004004 [Orbilia javanica]|uniref:Terpene synthase n=1 Tax=Orbilia javanica TaxID=47235 RepID=A0AAN8MX89_9PEZI